MRLEFSPFPELHTPRLHLRQLEPADAPALFLMRSDERAMKFVPRPLHTTVDESAALIEVILTDLRNAEGITWAICLRNTPELIGTIGLWKMDKPNHRAEIGYMLNADFWGKGFATEALAAVEQYGFGKMNIHSIEAKLDPAHIASARVLEKRGFVLEAHFRENFLHGGQFLDTLVYAKLCHQ
jgi:[ribosomal protein S5]-alanine N-acetyltransferase